MDILAQLCKVGICEASDELTPVSLASANQCFCLTTKNNKWFVKAFVVDPIASLHRENLLKLERVLAQHGLCQAPEFIALDFSFAVYPWLDVSSSIQTEGEAISKLGRLMGRYHQTISDSHKTVTRFIQPEVTLQYVQAYREKLQDSDELVPAYDALYASFAVIGAKEQGRPKVLCHSDLSVDNIQSSSDLILDWEYARFGSAELDLARCVVTNDFNLAQTNQLLHEYQAIRAVEIDAELLSAHIDVSKWLSMCWYALHQK